MQFGFFATLKELRKWRSPNALSFEHLRKPEIFLIIFRALSQTRASAQNPSHGDELGPRPVCRTSYDL